MTKNTDNKASRSIKARSHECRVGAKTSTTPEVITSTFSSPDDLEDFWRVNRRKYPYAAKSGDYACHQWIEPGVWLFSRTKEALIREVCQWEQRGIHFQWRQEDSCGYWQLVNLPFGLTEDVLFDPQLDISDDPDATQEQLAAHKLPLMFEHWQLDYSGDVRTFAKHDVVIEIQEWRSLIEERTRIVSGDFSSLEDSENDDMLY